MIRKSPVSAYRLDSLAVVKGMRHAAVVSRCYTLNTIGSPVLL